MSKRSDPSDDQASSEGTTRFAVFVPNTVFRNLEVYSIANTVRKQQVVIDALCEYLRNRGMEPEYTPLVKYSYASR
jgi:hypothetical protein